MANKPKCQTLLPWLKHNLGKGCLAPLTSTDAAALAAAVQIIELYAYHRKSIVLEAFATIVRCMQAHTQELAYHGIAHVMEWEDRPRLWHLAGLPEIDPCLCTQEPAARYHQPRESDIPV